MMDSDLVFAMYVEVANGKDKKDSIVPMTQEASALWDKMVKEVAEVRAEGYGLDIPFEMPDVEIVESTTGLAKFEVSKALDEKQFTLGPMYIPNQLDAHNEWTDDSELQQAVWKYVQSGDRRIRLQHNRDVVAGQWVEIMTLPYQTQVPMLKADGTTQPINFPQNTVFLGVIWEDWAWDKIKKGEIRGYSIGGRAERMYVDLDES
jgi:hypothetical protein